MGSGNDGVIEMDGPSRFCPEILLLYGVDEKGNDVKALDARAKPACGFEIGDRAGKRCSPDGLISRLIVAPLRAECKTDGIEVGHECPEHRRRIASL